MQTLTYDEIVELEPRIKEAEALAVEHAGRDEDQIWSHTIKPAFKFLVGFMSRHQDPRLHTCAAYDVVYHRLHNIYEGRPLGAPSPHVCTACGLDKREADSCVGEMLLISGKYRDRIRFGEELSGWGNDLSRCPDCGVAHGGLHHPGCDIEECPLCGGQIIACECGAEVLNEEQAETVAIRFLEDCGARSPR